LIYLRLTAEQRRELRQVAAEKFTSVSGVVREALLEYISEHQESQGKTGRDDSNLAVTVNSDPGGSKPAWARVLCELSWTRTIGTRTVRTRVLKPEVDFRFDRPPFVVESRRFHSAACINFPWQPVSAPIRVDFPS
jgi:Arc/MetJ-type ribon-helix-helix transcriptional regulator